MGGGVWYPNVHYGREKGPMGKSFWFLFQETVENSILNQKYNPYMALFPKMRAHFIQFFEKMLGRSFLPPLITYLEPQFLQDFLYYIRICLSIYLSIYNPGLPKIDGIIRKTASSSPQWWLLKSYFQLIYLAPSLNVIKILKKY